MKTSKPYHLCAKCCIDATTGKNTVLCHFRSELLHFGPFLMNFPVAFFFLPFVKNYSTKQYVKSKALKFAGSKISAQILSILLMPAGLETNILFVTICKSIRRFTFFQPQNPAATFDATFSAAFHSSGNTIKQDRMTNKR